MSDRARRLVREAAGLALLGALAVAASAALALRAPRGPRDPVLRALARGPAVVRDDAIGRDVPIEDPSGRALAALHSALRRAERGEHTARLAFYGGSHMAGDTFTGRVRERLQARFGDAGQGFVPLVPVVLDHWAWGVVIDPAEGFEVTQVGRKHADVARYGLIGVQFVAEERDAFAAVTSAPWRNGRFASRITLFYDRRPGGGTFDVFLDGARRESIAAAAPEPEAATRTYRVSDGPHRLEVRARGDGPVALYGVAFERDRPGVVVDNLGLVGAKARHQLYWDADQWRAFFVSRRPDLVALAYGNNELDDTHLSLAQHEAHLRAVLRRLREAAPDASCLLIGPTDRPLRRADGAIVDRPLVEDMTAMHRRVAFDEGCAFFDTLAFMGGLGAGRRWLAADPPLLRDDLMHLTHDAYLRWADVVTDGLLAGLD
ncbi:MAG TPA: GDSL-type esterase/lipase family protein [Sandaracinaceae bacterium]